MMTKNNSPLARRDFLKLAGLAGSGLMASDISASAQDTSHSMTHNASLNSPPLGKADYTVRIGTGLVELAPDQIISTTTYNGQPRFDIVPLPHATAHGLRLHGAFQLCLNRSRAG